MVKRYHACLPLLYRSASGVGSTPAQCKVLLVKPICCDTGNGRRSSHLVRLVETGSQLADGNKSRCLGPMVNTTKSSSQLPQTTGRPLFSYVGQCKVDIASNTPSIPISGMYIQVVQLSSQSVLLSVSIKQSVCNTSSRYPPPFHLSMYNQTQSPPSAQL